jgi:hypothetical protein
VILAEVELVFMYTVYTNDENQLRLRLEYQPPQSVRVLKLIDKSVAAACLDRDDGRYLQRQTRVKRSLFGALGAGRSREATRGSFPPT